MRSKSSLLRAIRATSTWSEIERVIDAYPHLDIKALRQPGKGKADAVYAGFDASSKGDV